MATLPTDYTDSTTPTGALTEVPATTSRGINAINTEINAKYVKPGGGIPSSDMTTTVQTSLTKADTAVQPVGQPYDISFVTFGMTTTRAASSYGDFPFGIKLQRNVTLTSVTFRCGIADGSGNLVVELRKNNVAVTGTSTTIAFGNQIAGGTSTGSWSFASGDILTAYVTGIGGTPGVGLTVDITGATT